MTNYNRDQWAGSVGANLVECTATSVRIELPYSDRNLNADAGVVHGGVQATLMHDAGWYLAREAMSESEQVRAFGLLDGQLNYLSAAKEVDLICEARLLKVTRQMIFVQASVKNLAGKVTSLGHWVYATLPDTAVQQSPLHQALDTNLKSDFGGHKLLEIFNHNIAKRNQGMSIEALGEGHCRILLQSRSPHLNAEQCLAVGTQYYVADNAAVYATFSSLERIGRMATTDLKLSFCRHLVKEDLYVLGQVVSHAGSAYQCTIDLVGTQSGQRCAFGTATLWT